MCGIVGLFSLKENTRANSSKLTAAAETLNFRGPDAGGFFYDKNVGLAQRRLSIIDTSSAANQPMTDVTERFTIIFNGEIFNFKELKNDKLKNSLFKTHSDTEVLLQLYIKYGVECLQWLRGFFALAIYDKIEETLFIARDNFGKKPLLYYQDEDRFIFASEMKALMAFDIPKDIDYTSLYQYFQLNYIPSPATIFIGVKKLQQGHYLLIKKDSFELKQYYSIKESPANGKENTLNYEDAQKKILNLMDIAVQRRLIADVPLGAFLSGGIDSSAVVALAAQHSKNLNTFSVGYKDEPLFDETKYANLVAKKWNTNHTVFALSNNDFLEHVFNILEYIDEPFADSSCIPTYILCKQTRLKATVALSGDGGDEVFAGYNKHAAEYRIRQKNWKNSLVKNNAWLWKTLPKSRNSKMGNVIRQLHKYAEGANLDVKDRYYRWCSINSESNAMAMFNPTTKQKINTKLFLQRKNEIVNCITSDTNFNEILEADMKGVLVSDMLHKVDMMSMANSLEVRSPFLDVDVVNFAFSLPQEYKIDSTIKKKIVQDAFRKLLPDELYNRPKQGFEIPLLGWFKNELKATIMDDLLSKKFIEQQGIFDLNQIDTIKKQLFSNNPDTSVATVWALLVFQYWWKKNNF